MQLAVAQQSTVAPQILIIGKNPFKPGDRLRRALHMQGIGTQIDADVQILLE